MIKRLPLFIIVIILVFLAGRFVINNLVAVSLIAYGKGGESRDLAIAYAPDNPAVRAARGRYLLYRAEQLRPAEGLAELERAAHATPFDYRYWLELGRAYETNGQAVQAEQAFRQALQLAPRYFETHWAWANFLLRNQRAEQAAPEFRAALLLSGEQAGKSDERAARTAYETLTQALGMNLALLRQVAPPDASAQAQLAGFLAEHEALDEALAIWRKLPDGEARSLRSASFSLLDAAQAAGRFSDARTVWQRFLQAEGLSNESAVDNLLANGGFEMEPVFARFPDLPGGFDWRIGAHTEVRVRRDDAQAHTGAYALRLTFAAQMRSEFQQVAQLAVVEPQKQYRLRCFVKTQSLPERAPFIEIADAINPQALAVRVPLPAGTNQWREVALTFTTAAETRAVRITVRAPQLVEVNSANVAEAWLDDFSLELLADEQAR